MDSCMPHHSRYLGCFWIISIELSASVTFVSTILYMGEHIWCSQTQNCRSTQHVRIYHFDGYCQIFLHKWHVYFSCTYTLPFPHGFLWCVSGLPSCWHISIHPPPPPPPPPPLCLHCFPWVLASQSWQQPLLVLFHMNSEVPLPPQLGGAKYHSHFVHFFMYMSTL